MNTKATKTKSYTQRLADHLKSLGYPVQKVIDETVDENGYVILYDTNPDKDKTKTRSRLAVMVDPSNGSDDIAYTIYAVRWTKNNRQAYGCEFFVDDLMQLGTDLEMQYEIARLAQETKYESDLRVFDVKLMELEADLADAKKQVAELEQAIMKRIGERVDGQKGKVVKLKR